MRIFITGSTGVVGKRAIPQLIRLGHSVTAAIHAAHKRADVEQTGATAVEADLFDPVSLRQNMAGHDVVVNLATHIPRSGLSMFMRSAWRENDRIRSIGAANIAQIAGDLGVQRLIQESFAPVYADRGEAWIDEAAPIEPVRYNRSVADAEAAVADFALQGGVGVVLRFAAFYGPDSLQLDYLARSVRRGFAPLFGPSQNFISSVSHDDAASAVVAALTLPAGTYNVSDDDPVRHREYVDALADALHAQHPRLPPPWATALTGSLGKMIARSLRISNRKLRDASNWAPVYPSVREGWPATVASRN